MGGGGGEAGRGGGSLLGAERGRRGREREKEELLERGQMNIIVIRNIFEISHRFEYDVRVENRIFPLIFWFINRKQHIGSNLRDLAGVWANKDFGVCM